MKTKRFLTTTAAVEVSGAAVEGFLNKCRQQGANLVYAEKVDDFCLRAELYAADVKIAEAAAKASQCELRLLREGLGSRAGKRLRRRGMAVLLAAVFVALLFWSKFYVWEIRISGNETVPTGEILSALDACGVEYGAFWPGFSSESIRSHVLADMPELAWISVNISGSLAEVQVVERVSPPELLYRGEPSDIVAKKDGFVMSVSAPVGMAAVKRGSAVSAGDILISGVVESSYAEPRFLRAQGSVMAETFTQIRAVSPEKIAQKSYTGREKSRFALIIGDKRIKFYSDSSISDRKCDTIISVWKAEIKGLFTLPISIVRETDRFYETQELSAGGGESILLMDTILDRLLTQSVDGGQVLDSDRETFVSGGLVCRVLRARCLEEIGLVQPMSAQRINEEYIYQQKADEINGGTQN